MPSATSRLIALAKKLPIAERHRLLAAVRESLHPSPTRRPKPRRKSRRRSTSGAESYAALLALAGTIPGQPSDVSARVDDYLAHAALDGR